MNLEDWGWWCIQTRHTPLSISKRLDGKKNKETHAKILHAPLS
jgi:hypothetical protein